MAFVTRKTLITLSVLSAVAVVAVGGFVWSGFYNVGADDEHFPPVYAVLETMRDRSIHTRAGKLQVPANLQDPVRITQGAGNYDAMCMGCHLAPGMADTELSRGLYPAPPNLSKETVDAASAFWIIKHGIKASGMPAWSKGGMEDEAIWDLVAFLQRLPGLTATDYTALVASSEGHSHGGLDAHDAHEDHSDHAKDEPVSPVVVEKKGHTHPPGFKHKH